MTMTVQETMEHPLLTCQEIDDNLNKSMSLDNNSIISYDKNMSSFSIDKERSYQSFGENTLRVDSSRTEEMKDEKGIRVVTGDNIQRRI